MRRRGCGGLISCQAGMGGASRLSSGLRDGTDVLGCDQLRCLDVDRVLAPVVNGLVSGCVGGRFDAFQLPFQCPLTSRVRFPLPVITRSHLDAVRISYFQSVWCILNRATSHLQDYGCRPHAGGGSGTCCWWRLVLLTIRMVRNVWHVVKCFDINQNVDYLQRWLTIDSIRSIIERMTMQTKTQKGRDGHRRNGAQAAREHDVSESAVRMTIKGQGAKWAFACCGQKPPSPGQSGNRWRRTQPLTPERVLLQMARKPTLWGQ